MRYSAIHPGQPLVCGKFVSKIPLYLFGHSPVVAHTRVALVDGLARPQIGA